VRRIVPSNGTLSGSTPGGSRLATLAQCRGTRCGTTHATCAD
jgi:hypothetical protein